MRYYLDTEFDERSAELISIGVVAQDGREFYGVNTSYDQTRMSDWLRQNVAPLLYSVEPKVSSGLWSRIIELPSWDLGVSLADFVGMDLEPEFWGYKCAWDIVLVHRLFGGYNTIGENQYPVPLVCNDLVQLGRSVGVPHIKDKVEPFQPAHNALVDARWNKFVHEMFIVQYGRDV
jgi:hypothetical protein